MRLEDTELKTDLIIVGTGIKPEVALAKEAGVKIGASGATLVDKRLRTNVTDVWAAGDCVESVNLVTGEAAWWVPLGDTANQMGRVVGTNAAKGYASTDTLEFPGVLGTGVFKVFDLGVAKTGLSEEDANGAGFEVVTATIESEDRAGYYPGPEPTFTKLIADRSTGRLLGAEIVGGTRTST